jgi:ribonuclease HI
MLHGMRMAKACGATRLKIFEDSNLVTQQVMNQCKLAGGHEDPLFW